LTGSGTEAEGTGEDELKTLIGDALFSRYSSIAYNSVTHVSGTIDDVFQSYVDIDSGGVKAWKLVCEETDNDAYMVTLNIDFSHIATGDFGTDPIVGDYAPEAGIQVWHVDFTNGGGVPPELVG
jgi:hypothetical protein